MTRERPDWSKPGKRRLIEWHWSALVRDGGMPVEFTGAEGQPMRFRWTGVYGVRIGPWFLGAVRGKRAE